MAWAVGHTRISLSVTRCGRLTAKAMTRRCPGRDPDLGGRFLGRLLAVGVGDVVGQLGRDGPGLDDRHADVGLKLDAQGLLTSR